MRLETSKPLIKIFGDLNEITDASSYLINSKGEEVLKFTTTSFIRSTSNSDEYELIATSNNNNKIIADIQGVKIVIPDAIVYIYYDQSDEVFKFGSYTLRATIVQSILNKEFLLSNSAEVRISKYYASPYVSPNAGSVADYLRKTYAKLGSSYSVPVFFLKTPNRLGFIDCCDGDFPLLIYSGSSEDLSIPKFTIRDLVSGLEVSDITQLVGNHYVKGDHLHQIRDLDIVDSATIESLFDESNKTLDIQDFVVEKRRGSRKISYIKDYLSSYKYGSQTIKQVIDVDFREYSNERNVKGSSRYQPLPNYEVGNLIISIWVFKRNITNSTNRLVSESIINYYIYDKSSSLIKSFSNEHLSIKNPFEFLISFDNKAINIDGDTYDLSLSPVIKAGWFVDILGSKYKYVRPSNIIIHDTLSQYR